MQQQYDSMTVMYRLLLLAAKLGNESAQLSLGYTYDVGLGIRRNRSKAMYWYLKAYRKRDLWAAANIGTIYRDEHNYLQAIKWFERAIGLGNIDSYLELAKIYLLKPTDRKKAIGCLQKVLEGTPPLNVCEDSQEEAQLLLKKIKQRN